MYLEKQLTYVLCFIAAGCGSLGAAENGPDMDGPEVNIDPPMGTRAPSNAGDGMLPGSDSEPAATAPSAPPVCAAPPCTPTVGSSNSSPAGSTTGPAVMPTSPTAPSPSGEPEPTDPPSDSDAECDDHVGAPVLRRLTRAELTNTLSDVLGVTLQLDLPRDPSNAYGFATDASTLLLNRSTLGPLQSQVHAAISGLDPYALRQRYGSCEGGVDCDVSVLLAVASALARRPLDSDESTRYTELRSQLSAIQGDDATLLAALEAAALSPHTLYRSEIGTGTGSERTLDGHEMASAIAYTYTAAPPDHELLEAAAAGSLADPATRVAQARRLLESERGRGQLLEFFRQWWRYPETAQLAKDPATYPTFSASIQSAMVEETDRLISSALEAGGSLSDLLLSPETTLEPELAAYYGFAAGSELASYSRPAEQGVGLLAQGSILARWALPNSSSPTQRGAFIRRSLLCETLPPPPPNVGQAPEPIEGVSTRARYESVHAVDSACAGCHKLTDQVGFAFEHFDGAGRYRATEGDAAIDASAQFVERGVAFTGETELSRILADMPEVQACLARHWVSFSFGVSPAQSAELAAKQRCVLTDTPTSLSEAFAGYAGSAHFALRLAPP